VYINRCNKWKKNHKKKQQKVLSLSLSLLWVLTVSNPLRLMFLILFLLQFFFFLIFDFSIHYFFFITCLKNWFFCSSNAFFHFYAQIIVCWFDCCSFFCNLKKHRWIKLTQHFTDSPLQLKRFDFVTCMNILLICLVIIVDAVVFFLLGFVQTSN
jgi:hypothetical protein